MKILFILLEKYLLHLVCMRKLLVAERTSVFWYSMITKMIQKIGVELQVLFAVVAFVRSLRGTFKFTLSEFDQVLLELLAAGKEHLAFSAAVQLVSFQTSFLHHHLLLIDILRIAVVLLRGGGVGRFGGLDVQWILRLEAQWIYGLLSVGAC